MNFRDNFMHLRAVNNMTQEQLAMLLGVSRQSVAKWEAGKSYPEMDKLIAMCQIFNCTLDELVQGDLTGRTAERALAASTTAKPEDIFGYDETMRVFANRISNGVMSILLGIALLVLFSMVGEAGTNLEPSGITRAFTALGLLLLFAGIAVGLAQIIPAGINHSAFVKAHPYIEDFYTSEEKARARSIFTTELVGGICCIFAGVCLVVVLSEVGLEEALFAPAILLMLVAIGVRFIIHGAMTLGRTNLAEYNQSAGEFLTPGEIESSDLTDSQKQQAITVHKADKRIGALCGTIMMVATIAGLVMLFVPTYWTPLFWLAWPIGGLLCGITAVLIKGFSKDID